MASTASLKRIAHTDQDKGCKVYKITLANGGTSVSITPGKGYSNPVGAYTSYSVSSGAYAFTLADPGGTAASYIIFFHTGKQTT